MKNQKDFKTEWPKVKKQLLQFSQDALILAKKGEREIIRFSRKGKLHVDSTALNLKREHLVHQIGKAYVKAECPGPHNPTLQKLITDLRKVDRDIESLKKRITKRQQTKKTVTKRAPKKATTKKPTTKKPAVSK